MKKITKTIDLGGRNLTLSTGQLAAQSTRAVLASYGETVVLATVVAAPLKEDLGYFPLMVEYMERLYAGGRIKGSRWVKREGRPSDEEILTARLIDRSIRPLFPKEYKNEVQVIITVLSIDFESTPDVVAAIATAAALTASNIPWQGPVGTVKVGLKDNEFVLNPKYKDLEKSPLNLVVSGTKEAIIMIENASQEIPEDKILEGIDFAHQEIKKIIAFIEDFAEAVGVKKEVLAKTGKDISIEKKVKELALTQIQELIKKTAVKSEGMSEFMNLKESVAAQFEGNSAIIAGDFFEELFKKEVRRLILAGKRPDGRAHDEIRELSAEVGILPRTHGSALFQRGQTQALTVATLGAPSLGQLIETVEGEEEKYYIHHYSMPPYSTGETGRYGWPSRREIGHGALAEKALVPVIPSDQEFPYTIRMVTEILSSNGSTSMASVCGSTLALMDAGVPIKTPVAGIAMGLIIESEDNLAVLTDIVGLEDMNGDMDFKVAGTKTGITALQLDVKTTNLTLPILKKALSQAKAARQQILEVMEKAISQARASVSQYAPKIKILKIPKEKIGELIGPGGKNIRALSAETGVQVDVEDDGRVSISGLDDTSMQKAVARVEALTREAVPGEIYDGEVKRVQPFGAFVEVFPGKEGMVHVSDMSEDYVKDPATIVKVGDKVKVRVKEIDKLGRVNLSMILDVTKEKKKPFPGTRGRENRGRDRGRPQFRQRSGRGGPHFPASKLVSPKKRY